MADEPMASQSQQSEPGQEPVTKPNIETNQGVIPTSALPVEDEKPQEVPVENRIAELNRKTTKRLDEVSDKISQLVDFVQGLNSQQATKSQNTYEDSNYLSDDDYMTRADFKREKEAEKLRIVKNQQQSSLQKAQQTYPELNSKTDSFDKDFWELTERYYLSFRSDDPEAPFKAAKLAAADLGKTKSQIETEVLQDDARRNRILSEGAISPRSKGPNESSPSVNSDALQRLLKVDPKKVSARAKIYKERGDI